MPEKGFTPSPGEGSQVESSEVSADNERRWADIVSESAGPAVAIRKGRDEGLPAAIIERYFLETISNQFHAGDHTFEYRLRKNLGFGTAEEIHQVGVLAYNQAMSERNFRAAGQIAEEIFGEDSDERAAAAAGEVVRSEEEEKAYQERLEEEEAEEDEEKNAVISTDATIAALEDNPDFDDDIFWSEMWDNFDDEVGQALLELSDEERKTIKVLDFFGRFGYDLDDLETYLPIRFS